MKENNISNSLNVPYNDLYENYQEHKTFNSTNIYTKNKDEKSKSN